MNTTPDESTHRAIQRRLRATATRGKTDLLVRMDHVAVGDAVRVGNDVHNLFDREGAADVVLDEDREGVAVLHGDGLGARAAVRGLSLIENHVADTNGIAN